MCLATRPGAQLSHTVETVYKSWAVPPESHVVVSGRDALSSALGFAVSQRLCQRFLDLMSWLGKLVAGPRGRPQAGYQTEGVLELGELFGEGTSQQILSVWRPRQLNLGEVKEILRRDKMA